MTRELDQKQAFQTHCLAQMGVTSWLSASSEVVGHVFYAPQPWAMDQAFEASVTPALDTSAPTQGFSAGLPDTEPKIIAPEEKEQSVAHLREQLSAGPEIVVEDLQPIEELAVDIEVAIEEVPTTSSISQIELRAYALAGELLIVSEVPVSFTQQEDIDHLAVKMGQALLKTPVDEWTSRGLSWPGALRNPYFLTRQDWLLGALESFLNGLVGTFTRAPKVVLAGDHIATLYDELSDDCVIKAFPVARIVSLPELYRIPELRKDAWQVMQRALF
ncbi:hypothetical protein [Marinomonas pollencensis]|uniref:Uncharacterized protein n=1 Tax=Marinomonas pollencensis TaxID=491954 RepID=A0A3E0DIJ6_9GAMM|nr:hypothetical protein [Marinomonas pollencensis]REG82438.1 hypothetical protein DFP81_10997 [Marinomonas pollencensis]